MTLEEAIRSRILVLDGAMGTALQARGVCCGYEHLNMENTDLVCSVHRAYIEAGADIIETNSFSANRISLRSSQCPYSAYDLAFNAAVCARRAADSADRKIYVAGSVGPTGQSLSVGTSADDPSFRSCTYDEMESAYEEQIGALVKGGADCILLETCFDALNTKAAVSAVEAVGNGIPVMISVTASDLSGRTLTGQTLEAFYLSVRHCPNLIAFGMNCSMGVEQMSPLVGQIASFSACPVIFYPNAGLPDRLGEYTDTPELMASRIRDLAAAGCLNIVGGCCGTTPKHISAIASAVKGLLPHKAAAKREFAVCGLEPVRIDPSVGFINIGERTNVAGSRKFARLIEEKNYGEALQVAVGQVEGGADIVDVNMDDPMLDSASEMRTFLRYAAAEPSVARSAVMIDSSHWDTIVEGLKNCQGRCIVNSISLKDGEEEFLRRASFIREMGASMVVMAFDEEGQAVTFGRKRDICRRSYALLTGIGVDPADIIFDCNILSIGTGISEHARFGIDFIEAVRWIKENLPGALTSGGLSNLSFAFRGNNRVREAMHSVFLYHAIRAGLDMAIVNPGMLEMYDDIDLELRNAIEDVIFDRDADAVSRLVALASGLSDAKRNEEKREEESGKSAQTRLSSAVVRGDDSRLEELTETCLRELGEAVRVIEGPLMDGMREVGERFSHGKMFLPQVVKSARTMRNAVSILSPYMKREKSSSSRPKFLIATVEGDVHDIGKNITSIVLQCSGFDVVDLGVMVPATEIARKAKEVGASIIGLSGLISPSLHRMEEMCSILASDHSSIPLFVGGAATSLLHTSVRLAPIYRNVHYGGDASMTSVMAKAAVSDPETFMAQESARQESVRAERSAFRPSGKAENEESGGFCPENVQMEDVALQIPEKEKLIGSFDWKMFAAVCRTGSPEPHPENVLRKIEETAQKVRVCARFFPCHREGDNIVSESFSLPMLGGARSLSRFLPERGTSPMGIFAVSVDWHGDDLEEHAVAVTLAETASRMLLARFESMVPEGMKVIMPGIGYPCCPDHSLKRDILPLLPDMGISLTSSCAMIPEASILGLVIIHGNASYSDIRSLSAREIEAYATGRGMSREEAQLFLGHLEGV